MEQPFSLEQIAHWDALIGRSRRPLIATHEHADGDAIGSLVGLGYYLIDKGLEVSLLCPNTFAPFLRFADTKSQIINNQTNKEDCQERIQACDLIIAVDLNSFSRMHVLGEKLLKKNCPKILIDHHLNPQQEAFHLILSTTQVSSASELVYHLLTQWQPATPPSPTVATALLMGIVTDTNRFTNSLFDSTFTVASRLMAHGAQYQKIMEEVFQTRSEHSLRLMGYALRKMVVLPRYQAGYILLSRKELNRFHYREGDTEGFVNLPLSIAGVRLAVFVTEQETCLKVSLRSTGNFSVNRMAQRYFNGGGHFNASGGKIQMSMDHIEAYLQQAIRESVAEAQGTEIA